MQRQGHKTTVAALARRLGITPTAARQRLYRLQDLGRDLVRCGEFDGPVQWEITENGESAVKEGR